MALIGSAAAYVLAGALNFTKRGGVSVAGKARLHLSLLVAAFFLLLAVQRVPGGAAPADRCDGDPASCPARPTPTSWRGCRRCAC